MNKLFSILMLGSCLFSKNESDDVKKNLSVHLKPFQNYIGKTFKGEFANSTPEKPIYDISHWERVLNGNAIRIMHSVNNGEYGGESIVMWDAKKESLVSWYFTTAGFYTQAILQFEDEKLISIEDVTGNENNITKVKAIIEFLPDGQLLNSSKYFINGFWADGHKIKYSEVPDAKVVFK
ncbi:uncharacterized protein METZ01_LOCUS122739 [marine metagenome]|uniref:Uncharacterized protein n=1 Tax=marine metagenome TaxID=408172 RepID=A0A381XYT8_9ZZZZ